MKHWNTLLNIVNNFDKYSDIHNHAKILLSQLNTASGDILKPEIDSFISWYKLEKYVIL